MKQSISLIFIILFSFSFILAQEVKGEGDIFMENNPDYNFSSQVDTNETSATNQQSTIINSETYIVDHLFTKLAFEEIKIKARNEKKSYFIDFTADWCAPCKMMDKTTFRDYHVVEYTKENYYAVQLDMTDFDAIEMQAMYNIASLPTILFFDYEGNLIGRTTGLQTGTLFLQKLKEINTFF
jgi:thioredoxin 1